MPLPEKRKHVTRACDSCKSMKRACSGDLPCATCVRQKLTCSYNSQYRRGSGASKRHSNDFARSKSEAPRGTPLREIRAKEGPRAVVPSNGHTPAQHSDKATPTFSVILNQDQEIQTNEPPSSEFGTQTVNLPVTDSITSGQYCGPTSTHSFVSGAVGTINIDEEANVSASIFSFGDRPMPSIDEKPFNWPSIAACRSMVAQYFAFNSPTYRIFHQPTVESWIDEVYNHTSSFYNDNSVTPIAKQANLLLISATSSLFAVDEGGQYRDAKADSKARGELYFQKAEALLRMETGQPCLGSVQARFLSVQYLLSSSRVNQAWYTLGTSIQLIMALGLHRKRSRATSEHQNLIDLECKKRVVWCSFTLDKYLSLMFGRPRLFHEEDIDQDLMQCLDDDQLTADAINMPDTQVPRNSALDAPHYHARLAIVLSRAISNLYSLNSLSIDYQINHTGAVLNDISAWIATLPPIFTIQIPSKSLIPLYRRQQNVLCLAQWHALMLATRPLLLRKTSQIPPHLSDLFLLSIRTCVTSACDTIRLIISFATEGQLFPSFWYSHYVSFNALSVVYIYLWKCQNGHLPELEQGQLGIDGSELFALAEKAQRYLSQATIENSPLWRYTVILQGLRSQLNQEKFFYVGKNQEGKTGLNSGQAFETNSPANMADMFEDEQHRDTLVSRMEDIFEIINTESEPSLSFWSQLDSLANETILG